MNSLSSFLEKKDDYWEMGLCPKPHFIFGLNPKNEAKKIKAVFKM